MTIAGTELNIGHEAGISGFTGAITATSDQTLRLISSITGTSGKSTAGTMTISGDLSNFNGSMVNESNASLKLTNLFGTMTLSKGTNIALTAGKVSSVSDSGLVVSGTINGDTDLSAAFTDSCTYVTNDRFAVTKANAQLTLSAGSEKYISKVTTTGTNGNWLLLETVGNTTSAQYTDLELNSTSTSNNGEILTTQNGTAVTLESGSTLKLGKADGSLGSLSGTGTLDVAVNTSIASAVSYTGAVTVSDGASLTIAASEAGSSISSLTLSGGTVTVGSDADHDYSLTTSTMKVSAASTVQANLTVSGSLTFENQAVLTMGCTVSLDGTKIIVDNDTFDYIGAQTGEYSLVLIENVNAADVASIVGNNVYSADGRTDSGIVLKYVEGETAGVGTLVATPEPATATLSLLAIAGLCARRRRLR